MVMKPYQHPEIVDIKDTSDHCSQSQYTTDINGVVNGNQVTLLNTKTIRIKNDRELDEALKQTFPASDAVAKYL